VKREYDNPFLRPIFSLWPLDLKQLKPTNPIVIANVNEILISNGIETMDQQHDFDFVLDSFV